MQNQLFYINNIYFLSIKTTILDMTINNPLFILAIITVIWFTPGIIVRRFNESKQIKKNKKKQDDAIKRLYPNSKDWINIDKYTTNNKPFSILKLES